jgi:hypothetical protein
MLAIFAGLTAREAIGGREQAPKVADRVRSGLARLGRGVAVTAAWLHGSARWAQRRLRCAPAAARWRFSAHRAVGFPPPAGKAGEPRGRP